MPDHTSAPWVADGPRVFDGDGKLVANCGLKTHPSPQEWANARLTAVAPEMLALLKESQTSTSDDWRERRDSIISEVEGLTEAKTP